MGALLFFDRKAVFSAFHFFVSFSGTSMQHPCNPKPLEKSYNGNTLRG
jgi:hypothetical protein